MLGIMLKLIAPIIVISAVVITLTILLARIEQSRDAVNIKKYEEQNTFKISLYKRLKLDRIKKGNYNRSKRMYRKGFFRYE